MNGFQEKKARILIVDDTQGNIQILGTILLKEGYQVNVARNGLQALSLVDKIIPDLILLDIMMPEMDGFETCRQLKSSRKTKDIPIVFLTARTDTDDIVKGFELGAVDYVTKPFNATELLVRVHTHLDLKFSKDMIESVSNERKELLHVLCHDLSNTFHSIVCLMKLLENNEKFDEMKGHLHSAAKNGVELIRLVRDMRALEDHKIELRDISLIEAIEQSRFLLSDRFTTKDIRLEVHGDENIRVRAEKTSFINSVLNNIFTNAHITVQDSGIGMPEKILKNLFDISKATNRPGTEGETGTGFGMPLIRKFVSSYGGSISVSSVSQKDNPEEHGTEVLIKLLLSEAATENQ